MPVGTSLAACEIPPLRSGRCRRCLLLSDPHINISIGPENAFKARHRSNQQQSHPTAFTFDPKQLDMSLCDLCRSVSSTTLPPPRPDHAGPRCAAKAEMLQFWYDQPADDTSTELSSASMPPAYGFPYHKSMGSLAISAESCPLCALVQVGVQAWIDGWNDAAKNDKAFIEFRMNDDTIPFTEQLWLAQCYDGAKGFYVWVEQPTNPKLERLRLNLLTIIGFGVDSGSRCPYFVKIRPISHSANVGTVVANPFSDQFPIRNLEADSGCPRSLDLVASWLKNCTSDHKDCMEGHDSTLPTRVLEIGTEKTTIKLVNGRNRTEPYICLSYCVSSATRFVQNEKRQERI